MYYCFRFDFGSFSDIVEFETSEKNPLPVAIQKASEKGLFEMYRDQPVTITDFTAEFEKHKKIRQ